jgi:DNA polymerase elongation subunit (family B)
VSGEAVIVWVLTLYLAGVPIYTCPKPHDTKRDCMDAGWALVREYQQDWLIVRPSCEPD